MNTIAMKLQTGTAALAIAAAATLIPVSAQAAPEISVPTAPVTQVLQDVPLGPANFAEVNWWWFLGNSSASGIDSSIPQGVTLLHIDIPILTPFVLRPIFGALGLLNKQIFCLPGVAGLSINAYGAINVSAFGC
jgi:hypothetical protein